MCFLCPILGNKLEPLNLSMFPIFDKPVFYKIFPVSIKAKRIEVIGSPKTEAGIRSIQMENHLVAELRRYKLYLQKFFMTADQFNTDWLFPKLDGESRTPITCWCQRMVKVFKALNIEHSMHTLRHTHAANLLMNNYPVLQLSHRLGHADPSITLSIYSHLVEGQELDVNNYLPNIGLKQVN